MGNLHFEYIYRYALTNGTLDDGVVIMGTEEYSYEELRNALSAYTRLMPLSLSEIIRSWRIGCKFKECIGL